MFGCRVQYGLLPVTQWPLNTRFERCKDVQCYLSVSHHPRSHQRIWTAERPWSATLGFLYVRDIDIRGGER